MTPASVSIQKASVRRGSRIILEIESLSLDAGSFTAIIGQNGAGKTTLLKIMSALLLPDVGKVKIFDEEITSMPRWRLPILRRNIAYVPQNVLFNPHVPLTAREIVEMGIAGIVGMLKRPGLDEKKAVDEWIERLGLQDIQHQTFFSLSGGERQKALLAKAMVQNPKMLLLDEPTANLDPDWKERLTSIVDDIYKESRITVVIVSHETAYIPSYCVETAIMKDGRIILRTDTKSALLPANLSRIYGNADFNAVHKSAYAKGNK
jgi:zinc transport system ATP-binding protein